MSNPLHELDARILRATLAGDRARTGTYASTAILISQLIMREKAAPDTDSSTSGVEQLGASMASGIVNALTAPLLYASIAALILFIATALAHHGRRSTLLAERSQMLGLPPSSPPQNPDRPWR